MPSNQGPSIARSLKRVGDVTSAQADELFPSTQGKIKISHILVGPTGAVVAATPLIVSFRAIADTPVYATAFFTITTPSITIPGFELPAGAGLEAIGNLVSPGANIEIWYYASP